MAHGVVVYSSAGLQTLNTSNRSGRVVASIAISTSPGSYTVPAEAGTGEVFGFIVRPPNASVLSDWTTSPVITISGRTVSWSFPVYAGDWNYPPNSTIMIGIF